MSDDFDLPDDRVWLNAAHQGPLPLSAARRIEEMIRWKTRPHHLQPASAFTNLPRDTRNAVSRLLEADPGQITLANGASYGLHLIANGLRLVAGDQVVVAANDFPSDILPWKRLENRGVDVMMIRPKQEVVTADEVAAAVGPSTKVVCLTWVHSFSGQVIDLDSIGEICRSAGAWFVVNGSQGVGAMPMSVDQHPIDALVSVGFKWVCGPYATGFCWLSPPLDDALEPQKLYWLNALTTDDLEREIDYEDLNVLRRTDHGRHDIFCPANFLNFAGLLEALRLLERVGIESVAAHNQRLVDHFLGLLDHSRFDVMSRGKGQLSSILFLDSRAEPLETVVSRLESEKIDVSIRRGMIRLSPHFYNTDEDIELAASALAG